MVLFNHTDATIRNVAYDGLTKSRLVAMLLFFICKTAVLIFLMIAGANLLRKQDSVLKSIKRIVSVLILIRKMYLYIFTLHLLGPGLFPVLAFYFNVDLVSDYLFMAEQGFLI